MREGNILLFEDFSNGMVDWWVEGGQKVWVEDKRLHVRADPAEWSKPDGVCTVWHKQQFPANLRIDFRACCLESAVDTNNINFFFGYSDPAGPSLFDSRAERADADYPRYHPLSGNIVTFLNDTPAEGGRYPDGSTKARIRIRHCPGFELLAETFAFRCRRSEVYACAIEKYNGQIRFSVNGHELLNAIDPHPPGAGLIGLRTYRTYLWWDEIRVTELV